MKYLDYNGWFIDMHKIHRCKPNITCTGLICRKLYNDDERNQGRSKTWRNKWYSWMKDST